MASPDVMLVSLGTTLGWRVADSLFLDQLRAAGAQVEAVSVRVGASARLRRAYPVTDLVEALAARRTLAGALPRHRPRALVLSSTTAAMLVAPRGLPYAVRLDAPATLNRPGARNALLRRLERRALSRARVVLPWSAAAAAALPPGSARALVVPPLVERSGDPAERRERVAVAYTPDVKAKGLDVVCAAWAAAGLDDARLHVFGVERDTALAHLARTATAVPASAEFLGKRPAAEFRAALRRSRVYVGGALWEDFGQAPLEALADGALVATVPSGGPFAALAAARELAPELVAAAIDPIGLAAALRAAFDRSETELRAYRERAGELLTPYRRDSIQRTVERELLPALIGRRPAPR